MIFRLSALFIALSTLQVANASTYYVDSNFGNDNWSGNQPSQVGSPATDGPWQSLARVSAKVLAPGDSVLLKCGGIWNETLTLKNSGTATNFISIGAYPRGCTDKPIISGATAIPSHNWVRDSGNIFKTSTVMGLISFGTFEYGLGNWTHWSPKNNASMTLSTTCPQANNSCLSFTGGSETSLAISNNFALHGTRPYTLKFIVKAPVGVSVSAIVRRNAAPWDQVGLVKTVAGTGNWQTVTASFNATASLTNARLDFVVPAGRTIGLENVTITAPAASDVNGVFDNGKSINVAHYPNRGHNPQKPDSVYYAVAENADLVALSNGTKGSSYLTTGTDILAASPPAITPGTGIRIRTNAWTISDRKIGSVSGSRLYLDSPTTYPIEKDWGYFLYGQRWMLDEPGEWHYDPATKTLYVWMPDNTVPGDRVSVSQAPVGIDASLLSHIRIEGLAIQNVGAGVRMVRANNIVLRNLAIADTLGMGIEAPYSTDSGIENSQFVRTAGDAISAAHSGGSSTRFHAYDNLIFDSGIPSRKDVITSLPLPARAAIEAGRSADIRGNRIYGAGYIGIWALADSSLSGNHIENACLVLDDCSAIYTSGTNNNSIIENNTVLNILGGLSGKPDIHPSQSQGIYLDELSSGVAVRGNTVVNASNGIQLHNAANNLIENNTLYNNRRHHVWLQEGSNRIDVEGDIFGNVIQSNRFFSTWITDWSTSAVGQWTTLPKDNTDRFAIYDNNLYFTLLSPVMSFEHWPTAYATYSFQQWRKASDSSGVPRNLDPTATEINNASMGTTTFHMIGTTVLPNGNLNSGTLGWVPWNKTAPYGQMVLETCTPANQCLRYTAGASESLLSSPNLSVQKDQWYKVTFDLKTGSNGQAVPVLVRRGGGGINGYESLMGAPAQFKGTTTWERFSFRFKAVKTVIANDPVTLDLGARVDFTGITPGQNLSVANLEIVPLSFAEVGVMRSHILLNPTGAGLDIDCPDEGNAVACSEYVRFVDGQPVTWPVALPPHGSEIIYSRDSKLTDDDRDGIPDYQDSCNATAASLIVNASGCALGQ